MRLEPLHQGDLERRHAVAADPLIRERHPEHDRWKGFDAATGLVIGSTRYCGLDPLKRVVEIGWTFLARSRWSGRHNGETKRLMLAHAFRFVERVVFVIGPENVRSRRAVEKIGERPIAPQKNAKGEAQVVYEIARTTFAR